MTPRRADGVTLLCETLQSLGVDCVFGVPGTQNAGLFEGFRRASLRTVLSTHELAAAFMANGFYRASGRPAVLATIPGPGFTYALTGLAEARLDSVALIYLVGKPATSPGRRFHLQALDQRTIAGPLVKGIFTLNRSEDAARVIREAYKLAIGGEPGPVIVEMDFAGLSALTDTTDAAHGRATPGAAAGAATPTEALVTLSALFESSSRPVLLLGQGAFASASRLRQLAEALLVPVVTTPTARGIIGEDRPMSIPFDPLRGNLEEVNRLFEGADLILALGCKLGHNGTAGFELRLPPDRLVHVDAEPGTAGANYDARLCIAARVEDCVSHLERRTTTTAWEPDAVRATRTRVRAIPPGGAEPVYQGASGTAPADFFAWLRSVLPRDAIVVTDSGLHQILTRRHFDVYVPRGLIVPTDLQSMGFGLPAAIGAKVAAPGRSVVALIGDGGFLMSGFELLTARRENVAVTTIIFNDGQLNQIRMQQWANFGHAHAVDLLNPDFETLAESFGLGYARWGTDSPDVVERAFHGTAPMLIEVAVGDSFAMRRLPAIARAKNVVRSSAGPGMRHWLSRLGLGRRDDRH